MKDDKVYQALKYIAILMVALFIGFGIYDSFFRNQIPFAIELGEADQYFEDGMFDRSLTLFNEVLAEAPQHPDALFGRALSLMQLQHFDLALEAFNASVEVRPDFAGNYANRGILFDRMGQYQKAVTDYEKALQLDPEVAEGPGFIRRLLRNQPEKPPTIADRMLYLKAELAKPPAERLLQVPEIDAQQRSYKMHEKPK